MSLEAIEATAEREMTAKLASIREEFNIRIEKLCQRTKCSQNGADCHLTHITTAIDGLRSELQD